MLFLVFFPMIAAVLSYLIGRVSKGARDFFVMLSCGLTLAVTAKLLLGVAAGAEYTASIPGFCGFGLSFRLDGFRVLYALIGGVMWLMTSLLSKQYFAHHYHNRNRYYFFFLMTLGATLGVFLSDDLYTTFIFFEKMICTLRSSSLRSCLSRPTPGLRTMKTPARCARRKPTSPSPSSAAW